MKLKYTKKFSYFKNKSKVKTISTFLVSLFLLTSVITTIAVLIDSSRKTPVTITSENSNDELANKIPKSIYFNSLFDFTSEGIIFNEQSIKCNLNKIIVDTISKLNGFKSKKYKIEDIILDTKYYLESYKKLNVITNYQYSKTTKNNKSEFCILINKTL